MAAPAHEILALATSILQARLRSRWPPHSQAFNCCVQATFDIESFLKLIGTDDFVEQHGPEQHDFATAEVHAPVSAAQRSDQPLQSCCEGPVSDGGAADRDRDGLAQQLVQQRQLTEAQTVVLQGDWGQLQRGHACAPDSLPTQHM